MIGKIVHERVNMDFQTENVMLGRKESTGNKYEEHMQQVYDNVKKQVSFYGLTLRVQVMFVCRLWFSPSSQKRK